MLDSKANLTTVYTVACDRSLEFRKYNNWSSVSLFYCQTDNIVTWRNEWPSRFVLSLLVTHQVNFNFPNTLRNKRYNCAG